MSDPSRPPVVVASLNYLEPMSELPVFYSEKHHLNNLRLKAREVSVTDARQLAAAPALERCGFMLAKHASRVASFSDAASLDGIYRGEIEELIRGITGAPKVVVTRGVLRWSETAGDTTRFVNSRPGRFVHVDYSRRSFREFAVRHLGEAADAERWLEGRYAAYNIWRAFSVPPQDVPLALCDATTVRPEDRTTGVAVIDAPNAPELRFESSLFHYSPRHRWYYFRDIRSGEALVFKAFDSDESRVQGTPHCAFDDPSCPAGAPPRASIEIRAYAYWG